MAINSDTPKAGDLPTAQQVVRDADLVNKLQGKVILITGATSGLGLELSKTLYATGAKIVVTARQMQKAAKIAQDISSDPHRPVEVLELELGSFSSIKKCAKSFLERFKTLNVLICNAGVMACPEGRTTDGYEVQFGTNYLGHFLLFQLLKDAMIKSSSSAFGSRVVTTSSCGHRASGLYPDNYNLHDAYNEWKAYGQSKTAVIYMASEIERRFGERGLHGLSVAPGVVDTELGRHTADDPTASELTSDSRAVEQMRSIGQGAATAVWAAVSPEWEGRGGKYLEDMQESIPAAPDAFILAPGYASHTYDKEAGKLLWTDSLKMVGLQE